MLGLILTVAVASAPTPGGEALRTAQRYLDALYRGDGRTACRLLDAQGRRETGEIDGHGSCVRAIEDTKGLRMFIVGFEQKSPTEAWVVITAGPEDGGTMPLQKTGGRWLISSG